MKTRPLGPGAPDVSVVGFGGMPLSIADRPSEKDATKVLHAVFDARVTLIDTADVYCLDDKDIGHNERVISKAIRTWSGAQSRIILATKGGMTRPQGRWERNGRPDHLATACDRSLKNLAVEQIGLYQLHAPDPEVPFADSIGALKDLQTAGKIKWVGISNVTLDQIKEAQSIVEITSIQNRLNPFFRESLRWGAVAYCSEQGIGFLAYSPVGGGRLNKKLPDHPVVKAIAEQRRASPHTVVLAWVLAQSPSVIIIPAARTVEHAVDSTKAAALELSPDELGQITDADFDKT